MLPLLLTPCPCMGLLVVRLPPSAECVHAFSQVFSWCPPGPLLELWALHVYRNCILSASLSGTWLIIKSWVNKWMNLLLCWLGRILYYKAYQSVKVVFSDCIFIACFWVNSHLLIACIHCCIYIVSQLLSSRSSLEISSHSFVFFKPYASNNP